MTNIAPIEKCVVLITGGASGLGYAMVENFVKNKANKVVIVDLDEEKGKKAVETFGDAVEFYKCNLVNDKELDALVEKYNKIQVLINNAGRGDEENIQLTVDLNLTTVIKLSLKFYNLPNPPHTIINVVSIFGFRDSLGLGPVYQASKHGVTGLVKSLGYKRNFEKTGIRVIGLCPGMTRTEMTDELYNYENWPIPEWKKQGYKEFLENNIWQQPEDVGKAMVEVYKKGSSGSFWLIEGGKLEEIDLEYSF